MVSLVLCLHLFGFPTCWQLFFFIYFIHFTVFNKEGVSPQYSRNVYICSELLIIVCMLYFNDWVFNTMFLLIKKIELSVSIFSFSKPSSKKHYNLKKSFTYCRILVCYENKWKKPEIVCVFFKFDFCMNYFELVVLKLIFLFFHFILVRICDFCILYLRQDSYIYFCLLSN